jgi:hypothetical protein
MAARFGGGDGLKIVRAAFSPLIKFSNLSSHVLSLVDGLDLKWDELESDENRETKMKEFVKDDGSFEHIFKRWESAQKMRPYIASVK